MRLTRAGLGVVVAIALSGCASDGLRDLRGTSDGPDEFMVSPVKPLEQPQDLSALPTPTPETTNRAELRPVEDAMLALGGRLGDETAPLPAGDNALVAHSKRFGTAADIRATLADEDVAFRKRFGRFTQLSIVPVDRYNEIYQRQAINPFFVAERYRRAGITTPTAPPPGTSPR